MKMTTQRLEQLCRRAFKDVSVNGDWINFACPVAPFSAEHKYKEDSRPSAGASVGKGGVVYWHCFTCKGSGSLHNLVNYLNRKNKNPKYEALQKELQSEQDEQSYEDLMAIEEVDTPLPLDYVDIFEPLSKFPDSEKYLLNRKVSLTTANKLGLVYDPDGKRIVFPVKDLEGRTYGFTGRSTLENSYAKIKDYYFKKSAFILGVEHWQKDLPVILVEGLFAFARLHEITKGKYFPYNIGAIMGSSLSTEQLNILLNFGSNVYCLLDNDNAGKVGMYGKFPQTDWSYKKKELEKAKGMVYRLKDQLPTFICKWPIDAETQLTQLEKTDPDDLTYDELWHMLNEKNIVI